MRQEPCEDSEIPVLPDERIGRYDVMICRWVMQE